MRCQNIIKCIRVPHGLCGGELRGRRRDGGTGAHQQWDDGGLSDPVVGMAIQRGDEERYIGPWCKGRQTLWPVVRLPRDENRDDERDESEEGHARYDVA